MTQYSITYSDVTDYEIVRLEKGKRPAVVQTNIRTREKAHRALEDWCDRSEGADIAYDMIRVVSNAIAAEIRRQRALDPPTYNIHRISLAAIMAMVEWAHQHPEGPWPKKMT